MQKNSTKYESTQTFKDAMSRSPLGISSKQPSIHHSLYYTPEVQQRLSEIRAAQDANKNPDEMTNAEFVAMVQKIKEDRTPGTIKFELSEESPDVKVPHIGELNQDSSDIS